MEADKKTVERIIKLRKNLSNMEYINEVKKESASLEKIEKTKKDIEEILRSLKDRGFVVAFPFSKKMEELALSISQDKTALANSLMSKAGPCWERIKEKNALFAFYLGNAKEITELNNILNKLPEAEREKVRIAIEAGDLVEEIELSSHQKEMEKALNRIGIACVTNANKILKGQIENREMKIYIKDKSVWIPMNEKDIVSSVIKEWEAVGVQIQIKNAKRQIMQFDPNEEKEFEGMQLRYLEMIKKVDEILVKYGS
ncbi:MAG: hypothetical protein NTY68_02380 [Candidatus Micrarchaeota archaeon]|nr:hypothetical protein [Candidatus Micrarchaeota archaeon]